MTVGQKIKMLRKEKGITQKELAEITRIAEITIRQYEAGKYILLIVIPSQVNAQIMITVLIAFLSNFLNFSSAPIHRSIPTTNTAINTTNVVGIHS